MKNFIQEGDVITVVAPYALASGDGCLVGSIFGVATNAAANGTSVEISIEGVVELKAASADTGAVGAKIYWDNAAKQLTTTAAGNALVGALTVAKTAGQLSATVRLNGISV